MASRPHTTYKKRQKELARMEKQRDKAAKRLQRKLEKQSSANAGDQEAGSLDEPEADAGEGSHDDSASEMDEPNA